MDDEDFAPQASSTTARWIALGLLSGCGLILGFFACVVSTPPPEVPREPLPVTAASFAGFESCRECHSDIVDEYLLTGHARTFTPTRDSVFAKAMGGVEFVDPNRDVRFRFAFDGQDGLSVTIPGEFRDEPFPLQYALGSNQHAQTFLTLLPSIDGDTEGVEHRVTVFGKSGQLGVTPSHAGRPIRQAVENFGVIQPPDTARACVGCHTTYFEIENSSLAEVLPNVQCESCHGPAAEHVAKMRAGTPDNSVASLAGGTPDAFAKQIETCGRCHRNVQEFNSADIVQSNRQLVRFQPVGLVQSRCFIESGRMLGCSTCHNPHRPALEADASAIAACIKCHEPGKTHQTTCPVSPKTGCIACHMPPVEVHPGIAFHDHWIRVRDQSAGSEKPGNTEASALVP